MFNRSYLESHIKTAIFFDFDDVLHNPDRIDIKIKHSYIVDKNGQLFGHLINPSLLKKINKYAIDHHIPFYIITARPDSNKKYICSIINEIVGFNYNSVGGFKENNIHCLGVEAYSETLKRPHVICLKKLKVEQIQEIHQTELKHLSKNQLLFSDDELRHINPAKEANYPTIQAIGQGNDEHLSYIFNFMLTHTDAPQLNTSCLCSNDFRLFKNLEKSFLEENRHKNSEMQREYDKRFGLILPIEKRLFT